MPSRRCCVSLSLPLTSLMQPCVESLTLASIERHELAGPLARLCPSRPCPELWLFYPFVFASTQTQDTPDDRTRRVTRCYVHIARRVAYCLLTLTLPRNLSRRRPLAHATLAASASFRGETAQLAREGKHRTQVREQGLLVQA